MNIYCCWYQGILGYSCRRGKGWMFVPELGQPDNRIHKNIELTELVFMNNEERRFEMKNEALRNSKTLGGLFRYILHQRRRPRSVNGELLISH